MYKAHFDSKELSFASDQHRIVIDNRIMIHTADNTFSLFIKI